MTLCADAGNSTIKIAVVDRGRVGPVVAVASTASARAIDAAVRRAQRGGARRGACAFSSVYPAVNAVIAAALRRTTGEAPLRISHRIPLPVRIGVRHPERLGADRICAAVGAVGTRGSGAVVVDVGTAITVDLVTDRVFRGGVILAGPDMALGALHAGTAALPAVDFRTGAFPPGGIDRTDLAMRWGAGLAAAGGIREAVAMLQRRVGRRLPVVVTGGGVSRIASLLPSSYRVRPHLTLIGIDTIYRLSRR
ncbi:MAG: type III pantothenate kinase [Candidatus Krumholzibacteria bacterium]|nr:type III pantothenate kinase [Candidatus Krumholzibacteria bacterium]MDH4336642.1 type III pantothenate kinase [Candidatus Krumholzibacteria bacterium]MDH5268985.1 type III pantothenate kinase [Candidatus Krumholzibacteria bacterium]